MRILVHDYAGHPFQVQLSRALARRGHEVRHAYCASLPNTAHGALTRNDEDPAGFSVAGIRLKQPLDKYSYVRRWRQENEYGGLIAREVSRFRPEVVLSANTPLDAQHTLLAACPSQHIRFVFWLQDLLGVATHRVLRKKIPVIGEMIGRRYLGRERNLLRHSDAVVMITEDFRPILHEARVPDERLHVIENWAPLEEMPVRLRDNEWARDHGLADVRCLLYSGNLGMKHNPDLLLRLALKFKGQPDVRIVVVSEGLGADWLRERQGAFENLLVLGFQPFELLPDVLATADVLVALLEPDAGVFSVPSKVLSYFCAARPVLLAVPPENLAARITTRHGAGMVVPPDDPEAFVSAAGTLLADHALRESMGCNARAYSERAFDIDRITDDFEEILRG